MLHRLSVCLKKQNMSERLTVKRFQEALHSEDQHVFMASMLQPYCGVLARAEISDTNRLNEVIRKAAL